MTFEQQRLHMVDQQLLARGIQDLKVLAAFRKVPRHLFIPDSDREKSYEDHPVPIGQGQTISQPYIVALMVRALGLSPGATVLEVGTGSGYQAAVLAELASEVYTIERDPVLAEKAGQVLTELGYRNIEIRVGDGTVGWSEAAPFDGIVVAAAAPRVPRALLSQLAEGGRFLIPLGDASSQMLTLIERKADRFERTELCGCLFVPLIEDT